MNIPCTCSVLYVRGSIPTNTFHSVWPGAGDTGGADIVGAQRFQAKARRDGWRAGGWLDAESSASAVA